MIDAAGAISVSDPAATARIIPTAHKSRTRHSTGAQHCDCGSGQDEKFNNSTQYYDNYCSARMVRLLHYHHRRRRYIIYHIIYTGWFTAAGTHVRFFFPVFITHLFKWVNFWNLLEYNIILKGHIFQSFDFLYHTGVLWWYTNFY